MSVFRSLCPGREFVTGLAERFSSLGTTVLFEFLSVCPENLLNFQPNANVCFSDYAFPYIILVLSLVTLAVYMSASEIEVGKVFSSVRGFFMDFTIEQENNTYDITMDCVSDPWLLDDTK